MVEWLRALVLQSRREGVPDLTPWRRFIYRQLVCLLPVGILTMFPLLFVSELIISWQKEKPHGKKKKTHGKKNNLTAKRITSRQKEQPHGKKNNLTAKEKPHGKKKPRGKKNNLTAKEKDSRQKEKPHGKKE